LIHLLCATVAGKHRGTIRSATTPKSERPGIALDAFQLEDPFGAALTHFHLSDGLFAAYQVIKKQIFAVVRSDWIAHGTSRFGQPRGPFLCLEIE
jgi:hypothetical protein